MTEMDPKALEIESLEVTELDDQDLEDVSGGFVTDPTPGPTTNVNCPCGKT
jgi:hypothetical protein